MKGWILLAGSQQGMRKGTTPPSTIYLWFLFFRESLQNRLIRIYHPDSVSVIPQVSQQPVFGGSKSSWGRGRLWKVNQCCTGDKGSLHGCVLKYEPHVWFSFGARLSPHKKGAYRPPINHPSYGFLFFGSPSKTGSFNQHQVIP